MPLYYSQQRFLKTSGRCLTIRVLRRRLRSRLTFCRICHRQRNRGSCQVLCQWYRQPSWLHFLLLCCGQRSVSGLLFRPLSVRQEPVFRRPSVLQEPVFRRLSALQEPAFRRLSAPPMPAFPQLSLQQLLQPLSGQPPHRRRTVSAEIHKRNLGQRNPYNGCIKDCL